MHAASRPLLLLQLLLLRRRQLPPRPHVLPPRRADVAPHPARSLATAAPPPHAPPLAAMKHRRQGRSPQHGLTPTQPVFDTVPLPQRRTAVPPVPSTHPRRRRCQHDPSFGSPHHHQRLRWTALASRELAQRAPHVQQQQQQRQQRQQQRQQQLVAAPASRHASWQHRRQHQLRYAWPRPRRRLPPPRPSTVHVYSGEPSQPPDCCGLQWVVVLQRRQRRRLEAVPPLPSRLHRAVRDNVAATSTHHIMRTTRCSPQPDIHEFHARTATPAARLSHEFT